MDIESENEIRRIELDGDWSLLEFSVFGRQYLQAYSFLYAVELLKASGEDFSEEHVWYSFRAYPWRGGWSAVDFFQALSNRVPKKHRPRINRIEYASPGFIELALVLPVALGVKKATAAVCEGLRDINSTYNEIQKGIRERKLGDIELKRAEMALTREQRAFALEASERISEELKFEDVGTVLAASPNELVALKILLSFYRRVRDLAQLENSGKMKF